MISASRVFNAARTFSLKYWRSTFSMKADREALEPAFRSTSRRTSDESVIEVFSFILLSYYRRPTSLPRNRDGRDHVHQGSVRVEPFQFRFRFEDHAMAQHR